MFGLSFAKVIVIVIIALLLIGPERLPALAARLAQLTRSVRRLSDSARERVREEMGPEFDDVDWKRLDPRQYDPRRIIRDALLEDYDEPPEERPTAPVVPPTAGNPAAQGGAGDSD
jgi:sec-independent protein translocase protein TatB